MALLSEVTKNPNVANVRPTMKMTGCKESVSFNLWNDRTRHIIDEYYNCYKLCLADDVLPYNEFDTIDEAIDFCIAYYRF